MARTMKGVYATVGWGAETVAKGRQFAADKEKRSEERKAKRAMARKQRIMDREKRRAEIDKRRSGRKTERDSLDRGDAVGRYQRRDVRHVRKTETGILRESRKELGEVQEIYKEKQNTVSEAREEKESANADLQRAKDEYLKDINQESRKRLVEGQLKKHFVEQVLMSQAYILDDSKTVEQHVKEAIAKLGENIVVRQFRRIELGVSE